MMKLSERLLSCAQMVIPGNVVADVGTDHGYLPIYLLKNHISPRVIASDLRKGPLDAARTNCSAYADHISFYLSDGLRELPIEEIQTIVCAGMGGDTIAGIIDASPEVCNPEIQLILQPQNAVSGLRRYLANHGFTILREILSQDGKFLYTALEVRYGSEMHLTPGQQFMPPYLLASGDPLIQSYFTQVKNSVSSTVSSLYRAKNTPENLRFFETALNELQEMEDKYGFGL